MGELTKESIFAADDITTRRVEVPEWNGHVFVRAMTGTARDAWEDEAYQDDGDKVIVLRQNARARLLAGTLCDEQGNLLFGPADIDALGAKSIIPLDRLFEIAMGMNALRQGDVDDLEKNSDGAQRGASGSD